MANWSVPTEVLPGPLSEDTKTSYRHERSHFVRDSKRIRMDDVVLVIREYTSFACPI